MGDSLAHHRMEVVKLQWLLWRPSRFKGSKSQFLFTLFVYLLGFLICLDARIHIMGIVQVAMKDNIRKACITAAFKYLCKQN